MLGFLLTQAQKPGPPAERHAGAACGAWEQCVLITVASEVPAFQASWKVTLVGNNWRPELQLETSLNDAF